MSVNRTELVAQIAERADLTKAKADGSTLKKAVSK